MKKIVKVLFYAVAFLYPVLVFTFLVVLKLPVRILSLCIMALAFAFFQAQRVIGAQTVNERMQEIASAIS